MTHSPTCCAAQDILNPVAELTAQQRFDAVYINSQDIMDFMGVSRTAILHARRRGLLPDPIIVNNSQIYVWERDTVQPYIDAWKRVLDVRRGHVVAGA